jgi:hypothetical protein
MARIRSIKPEVRISEKVNSWPIQCRYFWVLLWGYCDDYGYGRDNSRLIVADAFPLDDTITADDVDGWMDLLWRDGVIERYMVGEAAYFRVVNWDEHQKISHPAKQVLPTIHEATEILQRGSGDIQKVDEKPSPKQGAGSREKEQGAGEQGVALFEPPARPNLPALFEDAYDSWPKKVKHDEAYDRYVQACKKRDPYELADDIKRFGQAYANSVDKQYTPALGPWLYQKRWSDELPAPSASSQLSGRSQTALSTLAYYANEPTDQQRGIAQ